MKNTILKVAVLSSLLGGTASYGATFAGSGLIDGLGSDVLITNHAGVALSSGIAAAGYFSGTDSAISTLATTFLTTTGAPQQAALSSLITAFTILAQDDFVTNVNNAYGVAVPGGYSVGADVGRIGAASPLLNKTLYTFFGNGATLGASTQWGLVFHNGVALTQDDAQPSPGDHPIDLNLAHTDLIGTVGTTHYDASVAFGTSSNAAAGTIQLVPLAPVPEPSAALLGLVGGLVMFRRRR